jgi:hypothetical protein
LSNPKNGAHTFAFTLEDLDREGDERAFAAELHSVRVDRADVAPERLRWWGARSGTA